MKKLFSFFLLFVLLLSQTLTAQVSTYTFSQSSGTYTEITGGTVVAEATGTSGAISLDDVVYNLPDGTIPFDFYFNGTLYSGLNISSNGFITFGSTPPATTTYLPISVTVGYNGAVSPMGRDLQGVYGTTGDRTLGSPVLTNVANFNGVAVGKFITGTGIPGTTLAPTTTILSFDAGAQTITMSDSATSTGAATALAIASGEIRYEVLGSAPNRVFVIQYKNFRKFAGATDNFNFQIRLYETTFKIDYVYGPFVSNTTTTTIQVGLRGTANTDYINRTSTTDWSATTPGGTNVAAVTLTNLIFPPSGLTFEWTSPNFPPSISYTPLPNTSLLNNRNFDDVIIADPDGVAGGGLAPRVYWKVNAGGTWQSAATSSGSSPYDFIIGTSSLSIGDTVYYFVTAQDLLGTVGANPSAGFTATDVNTILTYPTSPNFYLITAPPLTGDYTVGVTLFRQLSGKDITFEKRVRTVEIVESIIPQEKAEQTGLYEETIKGTVTLQEPASEKDLVPVTVTRTIEQEYFVPVVNGVEYDGMLYHEFTSEQKAAYNLRGSGIYPTITAAFADANLRGVSGAVRFVLLDATYPSETFPIVLGNINGSSASNTITLLPDVGVTSSVSGSIAQPLFDLNGANYFIMDGRQNGVGSTNSLSLTNSSTVANAGCVRFINGASNNILRYVNFTSMPAAVTTRIIELATSTNPGGNSNNLITNCDLNGGRYGIWYNGTAANPNSNNTVSNSKIYDATFAHFYMLAGASNSTINNNEIYSTIAQATANAVISLSASGLGGVNNIIANKFYNLQNSTATSLRGISGIPADGSTLNIINNFFSFANDNGTKTSIYAIQISGTTSHTANIIFNSFRFAGVHTGGAAGNLVSLAIAKSNTGTNSTFNAKNNIGLNNRDGGAGFHSNFFAALANTVGTLDIDYNVWFANGGATSFHSGWSGVIYNNIDSLKFYAAPHEQNTIFKNTEFVSNTDLHLAGNSIGDLDLIGQVISGITTDIDGDLRDHIRPYRGADEGDIPLPVELTSFKASVSDKTVYLSWSTVSESNNSGFAVERSIKPNQWENIGFVAGKGTTSNESNYSFADNFTYNSVSGAVSYRLKQIDFDGSYNYSNAIEVDVDFTPKEYTLYQNYPNPFNPGTVIKYALPFNSNVRVQIYNLLGELVTELVNTVQEVGYYDLNWNAGALASGIYFYTINAKSVDGQHDFNTVKKMMLVK